MGVPGHACRARHHADTRSSFDGRQGSRAGRMLVDSDSNSPPLAGVLRDLVRLSGVSSGRLGREPPAIAADLADLLTSVLTPDFAFIRLCAADGSVAVEIARGTGSPMFLERLQYYLDDRSRLSDSVTIPADGMRGGTGIVLPLGGGPHLGVVAVA